MRTTLQRENDRIQALCKRLAILLTDAPRPGPISTGPVRDEIAAMMLDHMRFKEVMVYRPLRATAPPERMAIVEGMDALCQQLYADYVTHRDAWTPERTTAEWAAFKPATLDLIERLDHAILLERVHIYPLLDDANLP